MSLDGWDQTDLHGLRLGIYPPWFDHAEAGIVEDCRRMIDRLVFGVGTRLITSAGDSALDGVYKLVAVEKNNAWAPAIKISENPAKIPNPGVYYSPVLINLSINLVISLCVG